MKSIAIISSQYPSESNHYAHTFVHQRSKYFIKMGYEVVVYVPALEDVSYFFEGVKVEQASSENISYKLSRYDCVYLHLLHIKKPNKRLSGHFIYDRILKDNIPVALYIHGAEVQKVSSRKFELDFSFKGIITALYKDYYYIPKVASFYKKIMSRGRFAIATPSLWMKQEAESNLGVDLKNVKIIPNGIDSNKFKPLGLNRYKNKLLSIRQMTSSKYAVDISIKAMVHLPNYTLDLYGKGPKLDEYKQLARDLNVDSQVNFIEELIPNKNMASTMNKYKYFMCPTRMDAQGVSMCEAMSCGCVVITNNNTAIPEFVKNKVNGICEDTPVEMANMIKNLSSNEVEYQYISEEARKSMIKIDIENTLKTELEMLLSIGKS
ncbi:glycosyltransferase family 4 protein [Vibrio sp. H11]|uniref:glycosyltransferase family 4 protein n=1 Tax=Vibrio sp. H11 TaxID=2565928 RepID=UPI00145625A9|nr:glycosyltransferase family 4 protein [Vibrio sp. H11]